MEYYTGEISPEKKSLFERESTESSSSFCKKNVNEGETGAASDARFSEKAHTLDSKELNPRLKRRILANLGKSSYEQSGKTRPLSA